MVRKALTALVAGSVLFMADAAFAQSQCGSGGGGLWAAFCENKRKQARIARARKQTQAESEGQNGAQATTSPDENAAAQVASQAKPARCVPSPNKPCPQ